MRKADNFRVRKSTQYPQIFDVKIPISNVCQKSVNLGETQAIFPSTDGKITICTEFETCQFIGVQEPEKDRYGR